MDPSGSTIKIELENSGENDLLVLPMTSLPISGCWSVPILLSLNPDSPESFSYVAVVDTGSPFLTAPTPAMSWTTRIVNDKKKGFRQRQQTEKSTISDFSNEQYGATVGSVEWRMAPSVTLVGTNASIQDRTDIILGIPSPRVQQETGGIFLGLMGEDESRPTFMQQFGYKSFQMEFSNHHPRLLLSKTSTISTNAEKERNSLLSMYNLTPFGVNLHHYGVLCQKISLQVQTNIGSVTDARKNARYTFDATSFSRPLVAVLDTGLSGCIFSDTLWEEVKQKITHSIHGKPTSLLLDSNLELFGCDVELQLDDTSETMTLSSNPEYWRFQSFRLPWWYEQDESQQFGKEGSVVNPTNTNSLLLYPHVVVLGSTFWKNNNVQTLCVDTIQRKIRIVLQ
ncbi:hypothetical protein IV203_025675 [Nitzschia inconspicua]|uniref:Uncharacterized protein n=1 Tax=Nitzschia inconspicua TaxID=303405 RepID=A0A9K3PYN9_9STRA|nr:hypothetical protein IV203_025675 [Nitzschia inconspicua]